MFSFLVLPRDCTCIQKTSDQCPPRTASYDTLSLDSSAHAHSHSLRRSPEYPASHFQPTMIVLGQSRQYDRRPALLITNLVAHHQIPSHHIDFPLLRQLA